MFYNFTAACVSALKINGIFMGVIDETQKNFPLKYGDYIEVCPLKSSTNQLSFIFDDNFLSEPKSYVSVVDFKEGYLIKFLEVFDYGTEVLSQKNFNNLIATAYTDKGVGVSIETRQDFFMEVLPIKKQEVIIDRAYIGNAEFVYFYFKSDKLLSVYSINDKIVNVFKNSADDFYFTDALYIKEVFEDIVKHERTTTWEFNGTFSAKNVEVAAKKQPDSLLKEILPFAFFEEVLVGGNVLTYLAEELKPKANLISEYLGNFIAVTIPPKEKANKVGLLYKTAENLYTVKYASVSMENGFITNIKLLD